MQKLNASQGRFNIKKQLGEGSFSKSLITLGVLYSAYDNVLKETVALKVEKADKAKKVLLFEYKVLRDLQGIVL